MTSDGPVVELRALSKRFRRVVALDGLDATIPPGAVGLLGPNGAGKSTLLKVLLGLLVPDGGGARVLGLDPRRRSERLALRRRVGYMPEGDCLLPGTTAVSLVTTLGRLAGMRHVDAMTRAHEVLDYVGLGEVRYRTVDGYSVGMKQRLKLAQALVHDPALLFLDEPTNGLDPRGRREMLALVRDLATAQGKDLLVCSHLLPDVERTCEHVIVIDRGRSRIEGGLRELLYGGRPRIAVRVDGDAGRFESEARELGIGCEPGRDGRFALTLAEADGRAEGEVAFEIASRAGCVVSELAPERSTLEEVFVRTLRDGRADA